MNRLPVTRQKPVGDWFRRQKTHRRSLLRLGSEEEARRRSNVIVARRYEIFYRCDIMLQECRSTLSILKIRIVFHEPMQLETWLVQMEMTISSVVNKPRYGTLVLRIRPLSR